MQFTSRASPVYSIATHEPVCRMLSGRAGGAGRTSAAPMSTMVMPSAAIASTSFQG